MRLGCCQATLFPGSEGGAAESRSHAPVMDSAVIPANREAFQPRGAVSKEAEGITRRIWRSLALAYDNGCRANVRLPLHKTNLRAAVTPARAKTRRMELVNAIAQQKAEEHGREIQLANLLGIGTNRKEKDLWDRKS